ncbi:MAG: hypothetical protein EZS28_042227 [Streblomastix strix]|uniref:Uncharacterized protein n=1 Tax=Streblomastix strix TaxID=222440 RepID=A0A5J4TUS0_9EUKA|nr:MAG: hypothetical protein EZS28_042227 [Streblomastix strix]
MSEVSRQALNQLASDGQRYIRAPLGARGMGTCTIVQSCQVNWKITIPGERLALQLNLAPRATPVISTLAITTARANFNGLDYPKDD